MNINMVKYSFPPYFLIVPQKLEFYLLHLILAILQSWVQCITLFFLKMRLFFPLLFVDCWRTDRRFVKVIQYENN